MFSLEKKTAVITGAGSGIGQSIALLFARRGAMVYIVDVDEDGASGTLDLIRESGGNATFSRCDVTDQKAVVDLFTQLGRIDILVNNAGIAHIGKADTTSEEDFEKVFKVNVKGTYNCLFAALPVMKSVGGGVILNMASIAAVTGLSDRFAYSMSKGAVSAMTLSVARDYIHDNIRCNSISPARVHTPFVDGFIAKNYPGRENEIFAKLSASQPIGRMGKPEEVAALALYLCSEEAAFVTGSDYAVDGGFIKLNT
ncbi:SDR family NAD(P)-dependent oxidoreductase [Pedobacter faecalis]|uniref:SDR family NAD(P)-dependent oxidoreductase n=1 Tax=Pedobacter faecalis TaxID=3041495 RepID=UPI00254EC90B|nr:glucose 1-dehydrogenase [Pedobacter sp. ELA7]